MSFQVNQHRVLKRQQRHLQQQQRQVHYSVEPGRSRTTTKTSKIKMVTSPTFQRLIKEAHLRPHDNSSKEDFEIDSDLLNKGCKVFQHHFFSMFVSMLSGLLSLMYIPSIVQVLYNTNQSNTPEKAFLRYLRTLNHVTQWYSQSPKERLKSLKSVRKTHAFVAKTEKMTQFDMVITQWAFIAPALLRPKSLGMDPISQEELDSLRYVIYVVGKSIGIDEDLNLCKESLKLTEEYSEEILQKIIRPALKAENTFRKDMADYLLRGSEMLNPFLIPAAFKAFTFQLFDVPCQEGRDLMSFYLMNQLFAKFLHGKIGRFLRPIFSGLMIVNIYLANKWEKHILFEKRRPILTSIVVFGIVLVFVGLPLILIYISWLIFIAL